MKKENIVTKSKNTKELNRDEARMFNQLKENIDKLAEEQGTSVPIVDTCKIKERITWGDIITNPMNDLTHEEWLTLTNKLLKTPLKSKVIGENIYAIYDRDEIRVVTEHNGEREFGGVKVARGFEIAFNSDIDKLKGVLRETRIPFALKEGMSNGDIVIYSLIRLGSGKVHDTTAFTIKCIKGKINAIGIAGARLGGREYEKYTALPAIWKLGINTLGLSTDSDLENYKCQVTAVTSRILQGFKWKDYIIAGNAHGALIKGRYKGKDIVMKFKKTQMNSDMSLLSSIYLVMDK